MGRKKIYTEEERKERRKEAMKKWYQSNKEEKREYDRKRYQANKERIAARMAEYKKVNKDKIAEYRREWLTTPIGRASNLVSAYNGCDKMHNRGRGDLTAEWIVEHIFSQPCAHCGETDWRKLGCNRLDNTKPHSKDNVEPCCRECNLKLPRKQHHISEYS